MAKSAMAKSASKPAYRRVIVKVSGEALSGPEGFGIHQPTIDRIAKDLDRRARGSASRSASSSAAATSFAASRCPARACRGRPPMPWACWRPS